MLKNCTIVFLLMLSASCKKKRYEVITGQPHSIMATSAYLEGFAGKMGFSQIIETGFCYGLTPDPGLNDNRTAAGTGKGDFYTSVVGLTPNTRYFVRAYSMLKNGDINFGDEVEFSTNNKFKTGETGPAGGVIFYENPNVYVTSWTYMEAYTTQHSAKWGCSGTNVSGAYYGYEGTGPESTAAILQACSEPGTAAAYCDAFTHSGFSDWFLPTQGDLQELYNFYKEKNPAALTQLRYWSSTNNNDTTAYVMDFKTGKRDFREPKNNSNYIIAVRRF